MNPNHSSRVPAEVHTPIASHVFRRGRMPFFTVWPRSWRDVRREMLGLIVAVVLLAALIPVLILTYRAANASGGGAGADLGILPADTDGGDTDPHTETERGISEGLPADTENVPPDTDFTDTEDGETIPSEADSGTAGEPEPLPEEFEGNRAETMAETETFAEAETEAVTEPREDGADSETESDTVVETEEQIPAGCYPVKAEDMSCASLGAGHLAGYTDALPNHLPAEGWRTGDGALAVLVIHSHPYEGYWSGGAWYDPAAGSLSCVESPNAAGGVVALGAELTRALRDLGVTVIHLRVAVSAEDTASDIYDRTEEAVRSYCRLYPDIGLVLDLRRSAELTEDGGILQTSGSLAGALCAQVRISVGGGREPSALGKDVALALALRERLWAEEPSVSRPVRVKTGSGIAGELTNVRILTLEMGAAGNTYAEALRLAEPLAMALGEMILSGKK